MRWADLWRRAAGVADYVGQGAPGRHFGRWLCLNCPRDWHEPPFLPFRLRIHVREHRERFPDHAIAWWCWDHLMVEVVHTTGWRWFYDPIMSPPKDIYLEAPMCTFRRVKVTWPGGRELVVIVKEDPDAPAYCGPCQMSEATFRSHHLPPHAPLGPLALYHGAKVPRGRRLSAAQAARFGGVEYAPLPQKEPWQVSMPGVLVDAGQTSSPSAP